MNKYMKSAIEEARLGIRNKEGGPFGCVIVKDGEFVGRGHNQVLLNKDPTCHGEMQAIRDACKNLKTHDLSQCELYTTGEPCPMCLAACMWANIKKIYFGCTIEDAADIGFRDKVFFEKMGKTVGDESDYFVCLEREACKKLFAEYIEDGSAELY